MPGTLTQTVSEEPIMKNIIPEQQMMEQYPSQSSRPPSIATPIVPVPAFMQKETQKKFKEDSKTLKKIVSDSCASYRKTPPPPPPRPETSYTETSSFRSRRRIEQSQSDPESSTKMSVIPEFIRIGTDEGWKGDDDSDLEDSSPSRPLGPQVQAQFVTSEPRSGRTRTPTDPMHTPRERDRMTKLNLVSKYKYSEEFGKFPSRSLRNHNPTMSYAILNQALQFVFPRNELKRIPMKGRSKFSREDAFVGEQLEDWPEEESDQELSEDEESSEGEEPDTLDKDVEDQSETTSSSFDLEEAAEIFLAEQGLENVNEIPKELQMQFLAKVKKRFKKRFRNRFKGSGKGSKKSRFPFKKDKFKDKFNTNKDRNKPFKRGKFNKKYGPGKKFPCSICKSTKHWVKDCPQFDKDKYEKHKKNRPRKKGSPKKDSENRKSPGKKTPKWRKSKITCFTALQNETVKISSARNLVQKQLQLHFHLLKENFGENSIKKYLEFST